VRKLLVGECAEHNQYSLVDPSEPPEAEFEWHVVKALTCLFPQYDCITFGGAFSYEDEVKRPDLALIAKDFSHWFVVEVEIASHSLEGHVLPQIRALRFGEPTDSCISSLASQLNIGRRQAATLVSVVPYGVVVAANAFQSSWDLALKALDTQFLILTIFRSRSGVTAYQLDGQLAVVKESIGFGTYSAVDRAIRFPTTPKLPIGELQIEDVDGAIGLWFGTSNGQLTWLSKKRGLPQLAEGTQVQLIRSYDGSLLLRMPKMPAHRIGSSGQSSRGNKGPGVLSAG